MNAPIVAMLVIAATAFFFVEYVCFSKLMTKHQKLFNIVSVFALLAFQLPFQGKLMESIKIACLVTPAILNFADILHFKKEQWKWLYANIFEYALLAWSLISVFFLKPQITFSNTGRFFQKPSGMIQSIIPLFVNIQFFLVTQFHLFFILHSLNIVNI